VIDLEVISTLSVDIVLLKCSLPIDSFLMLLQNLIIGAILVDTSNLIPNAGKATQRDVDVVNKLKTNRSDSDLKRLFQELINAKFSIDGLSTMDLLLKVIVPLLVDFAGFVCGQKRLLII